MYDQACPERLYAAFSPPFPLLLHLNQIVPPEQRQVLVVPLRLSSQDLETLQDLRVSLRERSATSM